MNRRCKKVQEKKKLSSNVTSTSHIAYTTHKGSLSERRYLNNSDTNDIYKEKTVHVTPRNRENGRIMDLGKLVSPSQVLLRKGLSTKRISINHICD